MSGAATVAIVGAAGGVGASTAFNLLLRPDPYDVVMLDPREHALRSHVMDLEQVIATRPDKTVRGGDLSDLPGADVVVICASAPQTLNTTRYHDAETNALIVDGIVSVLREAGAAWRGTVLVVTNPIDLLCTLAQRSLDAPRSRVLGYALNDSLRLRTAIAMELGVAASSVQAWVIGEHGDAFVPLFERVTVAGRPVTLETRQRGRIEEWLRTWYARHVALDAGRSSTWTSGFGVARLVEAVTHPTNELWTVSVVLGGEYGIDGVALGVPATLDRMGASRVQEWPLTEAERVRLRWAAERVRASAQRLARTP